MKRSRAVAYQNNATYFITTTITGFTNVFDKDSLAKVIVDNLRFYSKSCDVDIHAFVIMSNHLHLLLTCAGKINISQFMNRFKSYSAKEIIRICEELGYCDLLETFKGSAKKYKRNSDYQIWQSRFDDLLVNNGKTFQTKFNYIHNNPVKKGLVERPEDYVFSSARFYEKGEDVGVPIVVAEW